MDPLVPVCLAAFTCIFATLAVVSLVQDRSAKRWEESTGPGLGGKGGAAAAGGEGGQNDKPGVAAWWRSLAPGQRKWILIGATGACLCAALGLGVYFWVTAGDRAERDAVEKLVQRARDKQWQFYSKDLLYLKNGHWAKRMRRVRDTTWSFERKDSSAFPFGATITTEIDCLATVSHAYCPGAESDEQFYPFDGSTFYPSPEHYRTYASPAARKEVEKLLYDRSKGEWIVQSKEDREI
jgi:hypothetical protein